MPPTVTTVIRTVQRGYHDGKPKPAGQVRRVHVIREEGPAGRQGGSQTLCGQGAWRVTHSPPIFRDAPHALPDGLTWCPACIGHAAEVLGQLEAVARFLGLAQPEDGAGG